LAPDDPSFIDATLSYQDMANAYSLEYNEYGVKRRVTISGQVHPDDLVKDQKQQEYYEGLCADDTIFRVLTPEKEFNWQVHEGIDYIPIASLFNNKKKVSNGNNFEYFVATPGELQDARNNIYGDIASFGVDVLNVIGIEKTGVSLLGEDEEET